jgi:hypothetical protein
VHRERQRQTVKTVRPVLQIACAEKPRFVSLDPVRGSAEMEFVRRVKTVPPVARTVVRATAFAVFPTKVLAVMMYWSPTVYVTSAHNAVLVPGPRRARCSRMNVVPAMGNVVRQTTPQAVIMKRPRTVFVARTRFAAPPCGTPYVGSRRRRSVLPVVAMGYATLVKMHAPVKQIVPGLAVAMGSVQKTKVVRLVIWIAVLVPVLVARPTTRQAVPRQRSWGVSAIHCPSAVRKNGRRPVLRLLMSVARAGDPVVIRTIHLAVKMRRLSPVSVTQMCTAVM